MCAHLCVVCEFHARHGRPLVPAAEAAAPIEKEIDGKLAIFHGSYAHNKREWDSQSTLRNQP